MMAGEEIALTETVESVAPKGKGRPCSQEQGRAKLSGRRTPGRTAL